MPLSTAGSDHDQRASPWSVQTTTRTDSDKWAARVIELAAPPSLVLEVAGQLVVCGLWAALVVAQSSSPAPVEDGRVWPATRCHAHPDQPRRGSRPIISSPIITTLSLRHLASCLSAAAAVSA
jgi:hypothetical protein